MSVPIRSDQIQKIHVAKARAGMTSEDYRAALLREGVESCKQLTAMQAEHFIIRLRALPASAPAVTRSKGAMHLDGPFAAKLRILWMTAWDCGVARDRSDRALVAFIERQTGISHPRWLTDPADGRKAVEGLKQWLARAAGIDWSKSPEDGPNADKVAVLRAQVAVLGDADIPPVLQDRDWDRIGRLHDLTLDALRRELGFKVRKGKRENQ